MLVLVWACLATLSCMAITTWKRTSCCIFIEKFQGFQHLWALHTKYWILQHIKSVDLLVGWSVGQTWNDHLEHLGSFEIRFFVELWVTLHSHFRFWMGSLNTIHSFNQLWVYEWIVFNMFKNQLTMVNNELRSVQDRVSGFILSPRSVRECERCSFTEFCLCVCMSVCVSVRALQALFFTEFNDTKHKNSIGDREEPYCLVTF